MTASWKNSIRLLACIAIAGAFLHYYMTKQNELTAIRLAIPETAKDLKTILEENIRLKYQIDMFENPTHLMELAQQPEFGHLKHPFTKDLIILPNSPPPSKLPL